METRRGTSGLGIIVFVVLAILGGYWPALHHAYALLVIWLIIALLLAMSFRIANEWERVVFLRLGHFESIKGPGFFMLWPLLDQPADWIDLRIRTTSFKAESTLTRDTVPVDVDGVFYWSVADPKKAALEVAQYRQAVGWSAQTALRDIIGRSLLADLLSDRERVDHELKARIAERTEPWGITVESVEIRDVAIPLDLQNAMSREAQAERERRARVILGQAEVEVAKKFVDAAELLATSSTALHLRAMNMVYEGLKEKGAMMIVPSSALDSMNLGTITGLASLGEQPGNKTEKVTRRPPPKSDEPSP